MTIALIFKLVNNKTEGNNMFKLEFDAANRPLAAAIGKALLEYGSGVATSVATATPPVTVGTEQEQFDTEVTSGVADADTETHTQDPASASSDDERVDDNGVRFNVAYCGEAQIPFYSSGKNKGQWKKKKGVDQADYDTWYAQMLTTVETGSGGGDTEADPEQVDTSAAFGGEPQTQQTAELTFSDAGQFMAWVAEQQTAGLIAQEDMDGAYRTTGIQIQDLFNPETAADKIAELYAVLNKHIQEQQG